MPTSSSAMPPRQTSDKPRRFVFVLANGVGAVLFWWGLIGLGYLIVRRLRV